MSAVGSAAPQWKDHVPVLPEDMLKELCTKPYYYTNIFKTVGPWKWTQQLGGRGTRTGAGACPERQAYGPALELPKLRVTRR